ncbi:MAG: transcription-repair coupling factor [Gammaproteobacteria bacterium]
MPHAYRSVFDPALPKRPGKPLPWGRLPGASLALAVAEAARHHGGLVVAVTASTSEADRLEAELGVFAGDIPVHAFPDWETLPYDVFSPHPDIISRRLWTLSRLPTLRRGILVVPVANLLQRLSPRRYVEGSSLLMRVGQTLDLESMRRRLEANGYQCVPQVTEHGDFAVRGSLLDLYPTGAELPYRIDLFDDEVESIRTFDPETQRSIEKIDSVELLPAREFPFTEEAIKGFRQAWRSRFEGDPQRSQIYREVSNGITPGGIEYYLPLFFDETDTLFDYLPEHALLLTPAEMDGTADQFWEELESRYQQRRHDPERPLLPPRELYLDPDELRHRCKQWPRASTRSFEIDDEHAVNYAAAAPPVLALHPRAPRPAGLLQEFVERFPGRILFAAESAGRREVLLPMLRDWGIHPQLTESWQQFVADRTPVAITVAPLESGLLLEEPAIAVISEAQIFGERAAQPRRRRERERDADAVVRNLAELQIGAPVVHEEHGVGRYLGLQRLTAGGSEGEFLTLEYAGGDKLYVPVAALDRVSRYTGAAPENAPLHKLGGEQWARARKRAAERVRDAAAELLDLYARRAASRGHALHVASDEYAQFSAAFPFEETPDQQRSIDAVLHDLEQDYPMDRVVCGDVGFGKTEVALRAAFLAASAGKQVAVLVPTTLLAQQHYNNFIDRFADWPIRVEVLSRFRNRKAQDEVLEGLRDGRVDIVIGTHKLLQPTIKFKNLGLVIIDEEHRFGVRQKERFKNLRTDVHVLTLTATPIPRTLNMALSGLRDLSLISTPPARRTAIKTFVSEWNDGLIQEACLREIKRGGQVYFVHNKIETIDKVARRIEALLPQASLRVAHGQMRESELERIMLDFYHRRFNILVCTTIIESGIDVPTANTIIIDRADHLGLAQLHQLRGRVGRSHHRAYAYLITPPPRNMTADAVKRLEAIESLEDLGAGFMLANHDLEIRGAGELLGEEQSGQIHEIGFTLYMEMLERAVEAMKSGRQPELEQPLHQGTEVEIGAPALIPDDYLPDVHARLVMYKRIASATNLDQLRELQVEMIDRFGLLPEPLKRLFEVTRLKLRAQEIGITKIEAGAGGGRITFAEQPDIDPLAVIQLIQTQPDQYKMDGQQRLRFILPLEEPHQRIEAIDHLLDRLKEKAAA